MNFKKLIFTLLAAYCSIAQAAEKVTITVTNSLMTPRKEMVETSLANVQRKLGATQDIVVTDANGKEMPSQATYDGKLIFLADVPAKGRAIYQAHKGTPQKYEPKVTGRLFTERQDEFGWENDKVAYRIYGHGVGVGYDIFNKNTTDLMLDYWYASEHDTTMRRAIKDLAQRGYKGLADQVYNAYCYHINHGKGMDCYTVGPTLGGGGNATLDAKGNLVMPQCYKSYKILDKGPLRFTVELTYPEQQVAGEKVTEVRVVTLDAGSHFNRVSVSYKGLTKPVNLVAGIVIHQSNPKAYVMDAKNGYMGYDDLGDASVYNPNYRDQLAKQMGHIFVGMLFPEKQLTTFFQPRQKGIAIGHILAKATFRPRQAYTYYFGSAWDGNQSEGIHTFETWKTFLSKAAQAVRTPLKVSVK